MIDPVLRPLWHMGALHPFEQALTLLLAFGPFVVLGLVVRARRRQDAVEKAREAQAGDEVRPDVSG
ncbi:hypothetical protein GCM10009641_69650 [Mycobacterium cookii]|uniref:Uncharacterized protein n=1 Tax=Nocardioides furvisabuli TaxID=375542 RepID=A0ABN2WT58_9ACTN|nr:hypothetical protein [Nocardioides furvisabuli]